PPARQPLQQRRERAPPPPSTSPLPCKRKPSSPPPPRSCVFSPERARFLLDAGSGATRRQRPPRLSRPALALIPALQPAPPTPLPPPRCPSPPPPKSSPPRAASAWKNSPSGCPPPPRRSWLPCWKIFRRWSQP